MNVENYQGIGAPGFVPEHDQTDSPIDNIDHLTNRRASLDVNINSNIGRLSIGNSNSEYFPRRLSLGAEPLRQNLLRKSLSSSINSVRESALVSLQFEEDSIIYDPSRRSSLGEISYVFGKVCDIRKSLY